MKFSEEQFALRRARVDLIVWLRKRRYFLGSEFLQQPFIKYLKVLETSEQLHPLTLKNEELSETSLLS